MHPDDISPYLSRDQLFETIRQQRIQLDRKDDYIRKLEAGFAVVEAGSWEAHVGWDLDEYEAAK